MATGHSALVLLLVGAYVLGSQGSIPGGHAYASGLREAAARRSADLARAPDGSIATDAPLPTIHAHAGVRGATHTDSTATHAATDTETDSHLPSTAPAGAPPSVSLWLLLAMTMVMALLSGVGALPYLFTGKLDPYWSGIANAVGCGVMLAASFDLLEESKAYSATLVLAGILLGVAAMAYSQAWLARFEDVSFSDLQGADARKAMLIIGVMAAHAFGEGSGVGVSFSGPRGWAQGLLVTIAIGLHNIPEGMAVATIMVARGTPPRTALYWTLLSALPQGIVAVPSYMFVETFSSLLPIALGFAAGCMIWIVFAELIPDALETAEHGHVATAATLSAAALQCISMVISKLERADGSVASPIAADLVVLLPALGLLLPGLVLAPAVAAGLAAGLLPSLPLSMGISVGVGAWSGLAGLLGCLMRHHLEKHTLVLWAAAGAAICAALWRVLAAMGGAGGGQHLRKDSGGGLEEGLGQVGKESNEAGELYHRHPHAHPAAAGSAVVVAANGWAASNGAGSVGPAGDAPPPGFYHGAGGIGSLGAGGGGQAASSGGGSATAHASGVSAGRSIMTGAKVLERRNGYNPAAAQFDLQPHGAANGTAVGAGVGGGGGGLWAGPGPGGAAAAASGPLHCQGNCSCKECDAKGDAVSISWGAPMDLLPSLDRPRECTRGAVLLGLMLALGCLPTAYEAAGALLTHVGGDASPLLLPLALRGLVLGAGCVGVARAAAGSPGWRLPVALAASLGGLTALVVAALLAPLPVGRLAAEDLAFDGAHAADRLRAFASGGLLLASAGYVWPAAAHYKPRQVQLGVSLGVGLAAVVGLVGLGLCAGTPYCLDLR